MARLRCGIAWLAWILPGLGVPALAQTPQNVSDHLWVQTANERSTLDRATGEIISSVDVTLVNLGGRNIQTPLHAVINLSTGVTSVAGAQGGPVDPLYGRFYRDLSGQLPQGRLNADDAVSFHLDFRYPRDRALTYTIEPHGNVLAAAPPVLNLAPLEYEIQTGESLVLPMTATDADSPVVTIGCEPVHAEAMFSTTSGLPAIATLTFTPSNDTSGVFVFVFTARDPGGLEDEKHVQITVNPVNRRPVVAAPATASVDEGDLVSIPVTASDPDGDPVTIAVAPLPDNAVFIQAAGGITFAPDYEQSGTYSIVCTAFDGVDTSDPKTIQVTVNDVTAGTESNQLVLVVDPAESPTLVPRQRITGTVNAASNLPAAQTLSSSLIIGLAPASARQGQTLDVTLTGKSIGNYITHFADGISSADFGAGITVNSLTVNSAADAVANITIAADAALGTRGVQVQTGDEIAVAVPAFTVLEGRASLTGILLDPDTGLPIVGAFVSIEGTTITTTTGLDGSFTLTDVPTGAQTVLINPPNHKVIRLEFQSSFGNALDLGELTPRATVFDPTQPASVSLFSVIGRGFGDLRPGLSLNDARDVVRDAFLLTGGEEVGVLDPFGTQLNGEVDGDGLMSVRDKGIDLLATRLAAGDTVVLMDVLLSLSSALDWSGGAPPTYLEWLASLQELVNAAWADPTDPDHAVPILTFGQGTTLSPDPPVLNGATRLTKAQAFLLASGFMTVAYNHRSDWLAGADAGVTGKRSLSRPASKKDPSDGQYTETWANLAGRLGKTPEDFTFGASSGFTNGVPGVEDLYKDYFIDGSDESLDAVREGLLDTFPDVEFVETIFNRDPYAVSEVMDSFLQDSNDLTTNILARFNTIAAHPGGVETFNLWTAMDLVRGPAVYYPISLLPVNNQLWPQIVTRSLAPAAPISYLARETRVLFGPAGNEIDIPGVEILFFPSTDDPWPEAGSSGESFIYRLWTLNPSQSGTNQSMRLLRSGAIFNPASTGYNYSQPEDAGTNAFGRPLLRWKDPLPPPGVNTYRIDCIRGEQSVLDGLLTNGPALAFMEPWFDGYLGMGDPRSLSLDNLNAFGREAIQPGTAYVNGKKVQFSALSQARSANVTGAGSGLSNVGRADLAVRYDGIDYAYASFPDFLPEGRGTGVIMLYDAQNAELSTNIYRPGFMVPGQVGLAIDGSNHLYSVNGASEASYGGKVFRWDLDPVAGGLSNRMHIGNVNYYSMLLRRPSTVSVRSMRMGPKTTTSVGPELYVADAMDNRIKTVDVDASVGSSVPMAAWHVNGKMWAENTTSAPSPVLSFGPFTDMTFDRAKRRIFVTQGSDIVEVTQGKNNAQSIFAGSETLVSAAAGCDVCEKSGKEYLYVADRAEDRILRIPLEDIPITVPADPVEYLGMLQKYVAFEGLDVPQALRIFDNGRGLLYVDERGFHFERFGFSGRAEDLHGNPLAGANVTLQTTDSLQSSISDRDGIYFFRLDTYDTRGILTVNHPQRSYTESVLVEFRCGGEVRPEPLVLVTNVLGEAITSTRNHLTTTSETMRVAGEIQPTPIQYYLTGGILEVTDGVGGVDSYPLQFATTNNEYVVSGVSLSLGDNSMVVRANPHGIYEASASERFVIRREKP